MTTTYSHRTTTTEHIDLRANKLFNCCYYKNQGWCG